MRFAYCLLAATSLYGQTGRDPWEVLQQARAKLQVMASRLEKYACLETVERQYFQRVAPPGVAALTQAPAPSFKAANVAGNGLKLDATDRFRLEVTVSQGREIQAWPGATQFDARGVDEIIRQGPIGTGAFGTYLLGVFENPHVVFLYAGEKLSGATPVMEYSFRVPLEASRYRVKVGEDWQPVAYDGTFWVDPVSLDLRRLTIHSAELPPTTTICDATTTLDYQTLRVGDSELLLPRQSQLQIVLESTRETNNTTTFSGCREYQAESALLFDERPDVDRAAAKLIVRAPLVLPIGLPVTLALTAPIDTDTAAAGDLVWAKVVKAVRRPGATQDLIPAGATVRGRIARLEHRIFPEPYFVIAISYYRVELNGVSSPFAARLESNFQSSPGLGFEARPRARGLEFWDIGTFVFPTSKTRYVLPAGYESKWLTLATR